MDIYVWLIILMTACVLLLEFVKLFMDRPIQLEKRNEIDVGKSMTIGSREVQEDQAETLETDTGMMAVLADGAGQAYGGRIASRIAVDTCVDIFKDYNAFNNPQYYFRKAYHCANKEILKALGDERRGSASAGCVLIREGFILCTGGKCKNMRLSGRYACTGVNRAHGCGTGRTEVPGRHNFQRRRTCTFRESAAL